MLCNFRQRTMFHSDKSNGAHKILLYQFTLKKQSTVWCRLFLCFGFIPRVASLSLSSPVPQTPPHYLIDHWPQQHGHNWSLMSDWGQWWYEEQQIDTITNHLSSGIYWLGLCRGNQGQINYSLQSISLCSEGSIHVRFLCNYKWIIQLMDAGLNLLMEADEHELHFWALYIQTEWFFFSLHILGKNMIKTGILLH